jgi:hypothetical protein
MLKQFNSLHLNKLEKKSQLGAEKQGGKALVLSAFPV